MLESSRDLLYIVLSLSALWLTVFLCWLLYQAARVLRNINKISESVVEKLEMISDTVGFIREKMDHMSSKMGVVSGLLTGLVEKFVLSKLNDKFEEKLKEKSVKKKKKK